MVPFSSCIVARDTEMFSTTREWTEKSVSSRLTFPQLEMHPEFRKESRLAVCRIGPLMKVPAVTGMRVPRGAMQHPHGGPRGIEGASERSERESGAPPESRRRDIRRQKFRNLSSARYETPSGAISSTRYPGSKTFIFFKPGNPRRRRNDRIYPADAPLARSRP